MITISLMLMAAAVLLSAYRLFRGPSTYDRLLSSDTLAVIVVAFLALFSVDPTRHMFLDVALVYAVIGFVGVVVIARFLQGEDR